MPLSLCPSSFVLRPFSFVLRPLSFVLSVLCSPVSVATHRANAPVSVRCAVLTISDTRTLETDSGGASLVRRLTEAGHEVCARGLVPDDPVHVQGWIQRQRARDDVQAILTTGGTGVTSRDSTYEAIFQMLDKPIPGFGELFRMLSYEEIGAAAMLSRACAGVSQCRVIIALPGSEAAIRLALDKLVLPELGHLVREASR
jgi:molybdenum cofactor biosynthesis protein B